MTWMTAATADATDTISYCSLIEELMKGEVHFRPVEYCAAAVNRCATHIYLSLERQIKHNRHSILQSVISE